jgi:hypothetical protein
MIADYGLRIADYGLETLNEQSSNFVDSDQVYFNESVIRNP